jgi:holo-[acyl-carrier protein] synthase
VCPPLGETYAINARQSMRMSGLVLAFSMIDTRMPRALGLHFMIISVGIDLVEVERIRAALEDPRIGRRFRDRVYTQNEIAYCERKQRGRFQSYAGRFAAKEAVMKALGQGWGAQVRWLDIEVARASSGKPDIVLHSKTARLAEQLGIQNWALSITHTAQHGMAYVIAQDE